MKLEISLKRINELMSRFVTQVKGEASMGRTDLNKAAETILIPLLNEVYGWNLKNINYSKDNDNYPGIDLADEATKVAIQVTATTGSEKIKHTVNQFIKHEQYPEYNRLIIFLLKEREPRYPDKTIQKLIQNKFSFDTRKDIWDYRNILKEVRGFQIDKALRVQEILEANFGEDQKFKSLLAKNAEQRIDWRETCRDLLSQWKGLTTNALMKPNGVRFQLDEIFVPLGVVERREKPKYRSSDGLSAEQGSELYEEKITPISQDDFFEHVLRQRQSKHSQGSRIAIIGEPGAGKTTQLQKIGDWILEETDDIPIWIPLAAVGARKLKDYLLSDWLQTAIQELEVSQEHRNELGQLLQTGKVWLLLDGVDEMAVSDALYQIATQMQEGWLRNVRVVLTCRLNVWDAGKNALDGFDVYRNLDFEYPTGVHQFIGKWFAIEPELQQKLKIALEQAGKERIRDMVKNPLRLTLLCYSWQLQQGELPETKAGLYEWFVDTFYEWNKGKVPTKLSATKREELNHALGELAREAIDQEASRFRLREKFVNQFLGAADDEDSLFYLALQLGWLNRVGVAEENPLENVYAFFHPTFQEYFAALAIDDWDYFLPREHVDQPINSKEYRVFELHWKESFLLWVGREELEANFKDELLFNKLLNFDDGCQGLYREDYLFSFLEDASREFTQSKINEITWFDKEYGDLATHLSDKWHMQRYTLNQEYPLNEIEEDFLERIGHWMHLDEIIYEDPLLEMLSDFDFETRKLKENKSTVEDLKIKYRKELRLINRIADMDRLIDGLLENKEAFIHGAFVKKILKDSSCDPSSERTLSSMLSCDSHKDIHPDIIWILKKNRSLKLETFKSLIDLLNFSTDKIVLALIAITLQHLAYYKKPQSEVLEIVIEGLSKYLQDEQSLVYFDLYCSFQHIMMRLSENISYPDFYRAWHSSSSENADLSINDCEAKP